MKLMIIESPGKVKKLQSILGEGWRIAASVGHIRDLPTDEMGVEAPAFRPQYVLTERGQATVARLKDLVAQSTDVYLATDLDREGESISWHLQQCLGLKNAKRVKFGAISTDAVHKALAAVGTVDLYMVAAQEARRVIDRLVGYMVSPKISLLNSSNLSAGRVQSVAVRLVVDREREIAAFTPTLHYSVEIIYRAREKLWSAKWNTDNFVTEDSPYVLSREVAQQVAALTGFTVQESSVKPEHRAPPAPFITSTLQQAASNTLSLSPADTMQAAQSLFDQGHITYHRTDNPNISAEVMPAIALEAQKRGLGMTDKQRMFKAPEGAQAGHPAVCPTHWEIESAGLTAMEIALYRLIRVRALASQLTDALYTATKCRLVADDTVNGNPVFFDAKGRILQHQGWLAILGGDDAQETEDGQDNDANPVPVLEVGQAQAVEEASVLDVKTRAPSRYTLASLIGKLEREGVGRPSTYHSIMENITQRGYIALKHKFLQPSATGCTVVDSLTGRFDFMELHYTREVEQLLDQIAEGETRFAEVVGKVHSDLERELGALMSNVAPVHPCPACGSAMRRLKGAKGAFFWGCSDHPACSTTLPDAKGVPGKRPSLSEYACAACGKPLIHRQKIVRGKPKASYDFWGCSGFSDGCTSKYANAGGKPKLSPT